MNKKVINIPEKLDIIPDPKPHPFCCSVRMTYTICAFLAQIVHLCMRNTLHCAILFMVKYDPKDKSVPMEGEKECLNTNLTTTNDIVRTGALYWTRSQQFVLQGAFYYGFIVTLPIAGRLTDKFGGKAFFVHSITVQALIFMLIPVFSKLHYAAAVAINVLQGLIAGCGNPALYQLFSVWAHPSEQTALLSFAYGGFSVGTLISFPISSFLCQLFGWEFAFYVVGGVSLICGTSFIWLVYSSLEEHPRLSLEEYQYLKSTTIKKNKSNVPWKSILTSVPVHAFTFTHIFHTYGIIVLTLMMPRFLKETMGFSYTEVGLYSSVPFIGSFISKAITIAACSIIERRPNINLTKYRRIVYAASNFFTILCFVGIILSNCHLRVIVIVLTMFIGIFTDLAFSGAYWPSLLCVAPTVSGLISGFANCLATCSGFLAPIAISFIVNNGAKREWDFVMLTLICSYSLGAAIYGLFGSSKLQHWDSGNNNNNNENHEYL